MLGTVGQLFPGLDARRAEPPEVAEVKGRAEMAGVIAAAVRDRQQVPRRPVELVVEQQRVRLDRDLVNAARTRARRSRTPAQRGQADLPPGGGPAAGRAGRALGRARRAAACSTRATSPTSATSWRRAASSTRELDALWPTLSAEQLLADLFADPRRLAAGRPAPARAPTASCWPGRCPPTTCPPACAGPRPTSRCSTRPPSCSATTAPRPRAREAAALREEVMYAQGVLDVLDLEEDLDPELLRATDVDRRRPARRAPAPCAATTPRPSGPPPTASGPTGT